MKMLGDRLVELREAKKRLYAALLDMPNEWLLQDEDALNLMEALSKDKQIQRILGTPKGTLAVDGKSWEKE